MLIYVFTDYSIIYHKIHRFYFELNRHIFKIQYVFQLFAIWSNENPIT
jgi:hypothetical protein